MLHKRLELVGCPSKPDRVSWHGRRECPAGFFVSTSESTHLSARLVIQPPVPRSDTVRARLAGLAWTEGLSAFVTNGVPFSFSSGRVLADGIAHVAAALSDGRDETTVMELGAGIGYLSAFCLDALARDHPEAYESARFVVSDGSAELVRDARSRGVLRRHPDKARFAVADLREPASILDESPHLLILSYLLDAIPPVHVEQREDRPYAARVETSIAADTTVIDGGTWPPTVLDAERIASLVTDGIDDLSPALARKIVPLLEETWTWVPEPGADVTGALLNSRRDVVNGLCTLLAALPDESAILVTDFGYTTSGEIELNEMMTEYGLCAFWAVAFDEIAEVAVGFGFETVCCAGEEGETHTLMIVKGGADGRIGQAFEAGFAGMVSDRPRTVLYNLEEDADLAAVQKAIAQIEATMPEADVNSYGNLSRAAHLLLQFGDVEGAVRYADRCVDLYPEVAAPEMTILGSARGREGDLETAETMFTRAIEVAPGFGNAWLGLSGVYRARGEWGRYLECVQAYLRTADCDVDEVMRGVAETLAGTELDGESAVAAGWVARR